MRHRTRLFVAAAVVILAGLLYYFYGGSATPAGQPPLASLNVQNFGQLRQDFNAAHGSVRLIALLSPT